MSSESNTKLAETVQEYIELYTNTTTGKMLELAWHNQDLERCYEIIKQIRELEDER